MPSGCESKVVTGAFKGKLMTVKLKALSGNSLLEYALPMVAFFLTGTMALLSGMPDLLQAYFTDTVKGNSSSHSVAIAAYGTVGAAAQVLTPSSPTETEPETETPNLDEPPLNEEESISFDLSDYPTDLLSTIETTGGNGTTTLLLSILERYIEQEVAAGNMTEEDSQILIQLANQGHKMAAVEKIVEDRYANSSSYDEFLQPITYDGVTYPNPSDLVDATLGWVGSEGNPSGLIAYDIILDPNADQTHSGIWEIGGETREFARIYQEAKAAGRLSDPTTDLVVTSLAEQISMLSGTMQQAPNHMYVGIFPGTVPYEDAFSKVIASEITDINSVGICAADGGEDSGVQCKK